MSVEFRITRGARAGAVERFEKSVVTIGRHPMNDLRFDPAKDLDVSSRHAELRSIGARHMLHDLGSTNGTYVNGKRIIVEAEISDGDMVGFGADGPQLTFHLIGVVAAPTAPTAPTAAPWVPAARAAEPPKVAPPPPPPSPSRPAPDGRTTRLPTQARPRRNTEVRIAEAVKERTGTLRRVVIGLGALVVVGGGVTSWVLIRTANASRDQIMRLLASNDSLARSSPRSSRRRGSRTRRSRPRTRRAPASRPRSARASSPAAVSPR